MVMMVRKVVKCDGNYSVDDNGSDDYFCCGVVMLVVWW